MSPAPGLLSLTGTGANPLSEEDGVVYDFNDVTVVDNGRTTNLFPEDEQLGASVKADLPGTISDMKSAVKQLEKVLGIGSKGSGRPSLPQVITTLERTSAGLGVAIRKLRLTGNNSQTLKDLQADLNTAVRRRATSSRLLGPSIVSRWNSPDSSCWPETAKFQRSTRRTYSRPMRCSVRISSCWIRRTPTRRTLCPAS